MSDAEQAEQAGTAGAEPARDADGPAEPPADRVFSPYGVASAALGVLAVAALVLAALIWSGHRSDDAERAYQERVLQTAADWVGLLANIDTGNVEPTLARLRDGTVGGLNAEFDSAIQPYREVVRQLASRSVGQVEAVAIESVYRGDDGRPRDRTPLPEELAGRTDTVLVVAASIADNTAGEPRTVRWLLRLDISDVEGTPMVSGLEFLR
ncbi:hypothetical protein [Mycobacterium sp. 1274756.6]|uniref:hypothetical protein n=1 Tax=Mycobacterium sp. 1274756.6 TaxID=1834076 RepID=UPI0007FD6D10|nr:hypothetical protein [Mycobacterium sp. 1274756.6]OBJ71251.1 hypothetical protein A5643_00760 [Mycobacterium sp. 1274756.6]